MDTKRLFRNYIYPIAVFFGGMIGVGFLSLPYIAMKSGIWLMLGYFLVLTALVVVINLIFCEISLKTPDFKRFPGFVGHHLGRWGEVVALFCSIFGAFGTLLAYLIIGGQFLSNASQPWLSASVLFYTLVYFVIASTVIFFGIKVVAKVEFWVLTLLFLSVFFIFIKGFLQIKLANIFIPDFKLQTSNFFLPYGPILFALWGVGLIPQVEEMLIGKKKLIKRIVAVSTIIVSVLYFLFILLILGITGSQTTETALGGIKNFLGVSVVSISLFAGFLAALIAFIAQGLLLKEVLIYDLGIKNWQAFVMTCAIPMILFLLGIKSFIPLLAFTGGVLLGIDGILILLMYKKIGGRKIIIYPLSLIFLLGVIYEIIYFVK